MTQIEMQPWLGNGFDAFWNGGIASTGHFVQSVIQSDVKNFHNSYLDITVQVGVVGLAVALGFLLLFFWRAAALVKFDRAPIAALPMFFLAFIMAYSLSEYALFRQHSLIRSEEHTSELQSLMRISYAVFCLKKKTNIIQYSN